jgi:hypothetical protein
VRAYRAGFEPGVRAEVDDAATVCLEMVKRGLIAEHQYFDIYVEYLVPVLFGKSFRRPAPFDTGNTTDGIKASEQIDTFVDGLEDFGPPGHIGVNVSDRAWPFDRGRLGSRLSGLVVDVKCDNVCAFARENRSCRSSNSSRAPGHDDALSFYRVWHGLILRLI